MKGRRLVLRPFRFCRVGSGWSDWWRPAPLVGSPLQASGRVGRCSGFSGVFGLCRKDVGGGWLLCGGAAVDLHGVSVGVILGGGWPAHLAGCGCASGLSFVAPSAGWSSVIVLPGSSAGALACLGSACGFLWLICSLLGCRWLWGSVRVPLSSVCDVQVLGAGAGARWGGRVRVGDYLPPWSASVGVTDGS